jgi:AcrR family transcriptional regulator
MDAAATSRPRIEGDRERQIFDATLQLLVEGGYDKLTLDAVAGRARASKATLYRRWPSKTELVLDAMSCLETTIPALPDTGTLRGDLLVMAASKGLLQPEQASVVCGLATAMYRDPELRRSLAGRFSDPRQNHLRALLERARDRGEIRAGADLDLLAQVVPALVLFQLSVHTPGEVPPGFVESVIDEVLLPALQAVPGH